MSKTLITSPCPEKDNEVVLRKIFKVRRLKIRIRALVLVWRFLVAAIGWMITLR